MYSKSLKENDRGASFRRGAKDLGRLVSSEGRKRRCWLTCGLHVRFSKSVPKASSGHSGALCPGLGLVIALRFPGLWGIFWKVASDPADDPMSGDHFPLPGLLRPGHSRGQARREATEGMVWFRGLPWSHL